MPSESAPAPESGAGHHESDREPHSERHDEQHTDHHDEPREAAPFPVVGIGASAGGLEAVTQLLKALPPDTGMAFVLVQHLSPTHESALAEILSRATKMPVTEAHDEPTVEPNHVYVIPPARCMGIADSKLQLAPREKAGHLRVIDHFLRALAEDRRHQAIGVILSGTASDGTLGLEAIKAEGGITFAQDDSAQHEGMPHSAIASGCVDLVLPPEAIAHELARIAQHPYAARESGPGESARNGEGTAQLARVLQLLHRATGVDFSQYKFNTLQRRITRRMLLQKTDKLHDYAEFLQRNPAEIDALYRDILINVTSFFRNPEAFEALKEKVFPRLLENRARHDAVRVWTLGCSTGQEAYSVAMAFTELAESLGSKAVLQVFATDLSDDAVATARAGLYPKDIAQDVSPERLRRFFVEVDGHYRIARPIRDVCVFSRHNMLADPPFSRLDLITCRNLLIYLEPVLQHKVVPTLHYALKPNGYLWLGTSETIGGFRNLFEPLDAKQKIYARKPGPPRGARFPLHDGAAQRAAFVPVSARPANTMPELHREADRLLLARFAPPSVLVSAELDILQYRGDTGPYLAPSPGKASLSLPKMLREGLLVGVRAALARAAKSRKPQREEGLRVKSNGGWRELAVDVLPLQGAGSAGSRDSGQGDAKDGGFLVLFDEPASAPLRAANVDDAAAVPPPAGAERDTAALERELAATRDHLQSVIEQQETANEELQSSNEEVQSANEELQSINEELETSKEEIQSSNEELATVNDELNNRNTELNRVNNDLVNVLGSAQMAIVLVGPDLRIRRFTPMAEKVLDLVPGDVGRPLAHIKLGLVDLPDLEPLLAEVLETVSNREIAVRDRRANRYLLRLRPYRTLDNRIDGVVLVLVDVEQLQRAHEYTQSIVETVREPLLVLDAGLHVLTATEAFYRAFGGQREHTEGRLLYELGNGQWNIPELRRLLEEVLPRDEQFIDYEVEHVFEHIGRRTMLLNARRLQQTGERSPAILLAIEDVTERRHAQAATAQLAAIVTSSKDAIIGKDLNGVMTSWNRAAQALFGYTAEEAIGQPVSLLIPEDRLHEELTILQGIRRGEGVGPYDTVRRAKDGSLLDIALTVSPLRDKGGRIVGASKIARDIGERKRAEAALRDSEERLRTLADNMAQFAWMADATGWIYWYNQRWYDYTGTTLEQMQGWGWKAVLHPDQVDRVVAQVRRSWVAGEAWEDTFALRGKDGAYHWFLTSVVPIRDADGHVLRWFGTNTDVTTQRDMAEELRDTAALLAVGDRRKNEFLATLAHELRNPLAPIRNALHIMRLSGGDAAAVAAASQMMERQVVQMVRLIDDLLDVSRISRGTIELRRTAIDLVALLQEALETARPNCASKGVELKVELPAQPLWLDADATRLTQVVGNLLNNACKFTERGGRVTLALKRDGVEAVITVRDTGIGIAAEQLSRIFEMFTQVDVSLERSGGLGIGLTLVKTLVELHGGTVRATSGGAGRGSEFEVRLPVVADAADALAPAAPAPAGSLATAATAAAAATVARRILVVDDNRDAAESLAALLQLEGHDTRLAYDGLDAVAAAEQFRPELVLLDIGLPRLNGYDAARRIREAAWGKCMVLVALTGWGQQEDRDKSSQAGFDEHLVKPVDHDTLLALLAQLPEHLAAR